MGRLLQVVGFGWALLGFASCIPTVMYNYKERTAGSVTAASDTALGFGMMIAFLLFVVPGVIVGGVGHSMMRRKSEARRVGPAPTVGEARFCSKCGAPVGAVADFCSRCGTRREP
jgi:hypothetical protein